MALKRKRSSSSTSPASIPHSINFPTSPVIYAGLSPSPSPSPFPQSHNHDISMSNRYPSNCPSLYEDSRLRLHSRTRKRVRNKPDELSIHGIHINSHLSPIANRKFRKNLPDPVCGRQLSTSSATAAFDPSAVRYKSLANISSPSLSSCFLDSPYTALISSPYSPSPVLFVQSPRMPRLRRPSLLFI